MFSIKQWWLKRRRSVVVLAPGVDLNALADRVHDRIRETRGEDNPLNALFKITQEEADELATMQQLREAMQMREWMHGLPGRQRSVLIDHVERGLNYKEIARERGLTYRIVLRDLTRAYATLRMRQLENDDGHQGSNDDGRDGSTTISSGLSGLRFAEAHVGSPGGICDDGAPLERISSGGGHERFGASGQES